jgi:hypothetical protein
MNPTDFAGRLSRRRLTGALGLIGASAAGAAIAPTGLRLERPTSAGAAAMVPNHGMTGMGTGGTGTTSANQEAMSADEMDAMHEAGVTSFPAPTAGLGGQPLEPVMDGDVKVFSLIAQVVQWEYQPG